MLAVLVLFLLPDQNQEAADLSRRDQEIAALRQRVAELERAQQPAKEPVPLAKTSAAPAAPSDAPAVFPARTEEVVTCPRCGRREGEAVSPERIKELRKLYPGTFTYCGCE